jgi:ribosome-associated heat shock protein Hsp15
MNLTGMNLTGMNLTGLNLTGLHLTGMIDDSGESALRLDKWLWAARFFRTRSLATEAVVGGKVHVNGDRCKPGRRIHPGDHLRVQRGETLFELTVAALSSRRGPAPEAQLLYVETPESLARRAEESVRRREERAASAPIRRPDKRDRRRIRQFLQEE